MNELMHTLIEEFQANITTFYDGVAREIHFPEIPHKILVAIGMRRTGKTYLLWQVITQLLENIPISQLLYINLKIIVYCR